MVAEGEDESLLARVGQGDENALVALMAKHREAVFRFTFRYLGDARDSAEVVEETFFRVYQSAHRFQPRASAATWIFAIARNVCLSRLRKHRRKGWFLFFTGEQAAAPGCDEPRAPVQSEPTAALHTAEAVEEIQSAIRALPERLRWPFVYCVLEGHSQESCAEILKTNRKSVETRVYRARRVLQAKLSALGIGER